MEYKENFVNSFLYDLMFGKTINPDQKAFISIIDKDDVVLAVKKAYLDMSPRTLKNKGNTKIDLDFLGKLDIFEKLSKMFVDYFIKEQITTQESFDAWHHNMCLFFKERYNKLLEKANKKPILYGKAQKIVNMTFKYLYCYDDAKKYSNKFNFCHMALDSYILDWVYEIFSKGCEQGSKITKYGKNSLPYWSNLEYEKTGNIPQYKEIQVLIRNKIKNDAEYKDLTPFLAEFKIWHKQKTKNKK